MSDSTEYPGSPHAQWRLALSRRFNHEWVDSLYATVLQPVLQAEGILLECKFAGEATRDLDFWMNRMSIILEIADIHVLIDVDRTAAVGYEFDRSSLIYKKHLTPALTTSFSLGGGVRFVDRILFAPSRILIKRGVGDPYQEDASTEVLYVPSDFDQTAVKDSLRARLSRAKVARLETLQLGSEAVLGPHLIKLTEMAQVIEEERGVTGLLNCAGEYEAMEEQLDESMAELANEWREWWMRVREGSIALPSNFRETRVLLYGRYKDSARRLLGQKVIEHRGFRVVLSCITFLSAIYARRKHGTLPRPLT